MILYLEPDKAMPTHPELQGESPSVVGEIEANTWKKI